MRTFNVSLQIKVTSDHDAADVATVVGEQLSSTEIPADMQVTSICIDEEVENSSE